MAGSPVPTAPRRPTSWPARSRRELSDASPIVFHTESGTLTDAEHRPAVESSVKALSEDPAVAQVSTRSPRQRTLSKDGRTAYATVVPAEALGDLAVEDAEAILDTAAAPAEGTGVQVEAGGQLGNKITEPATKMSELIGICAAMLILVLVFGTLTAMVLPIAVAIVGLFCGLSIVSLIGHVARRPRRRADPGDDDRPRRRDRLLAVHRHPRPLGPPRGQEHHRRDRPRGRDVRQPPSRSPAGPWSIALLALAVSGLSLITVLGQAAADRRGRRRARVDDAAPGPARAVRRRHRAPQDRPRQAPDARPQHAVAALGPAARPPPGPVRHRVDRGPARAHRPGREARPRPHRPVERAPDHHGRVRPTT